MQNNTGATNATSNPTALSVLVLGMLDAALKEGQLQGLWLDLRSLLLWFPLLRLLRVDKIGNTSKIGVLGNVYGQRSDWALAMQRTTISPVLMSRRTILGL